MYAVRSSILVTILEPTFFPYEIFLLVMAVTIFGLIFLYLTRSLDSKKEVQLYNIERKINESINESERILYETKFWREIYASDLNGKFVTERHSELIKKYLHEKTKLKEIRNNKPKFPLRELQEINKNPSSLEYFYNKRMGSAN